MSEQESISKTRRKKEMHALQSLGERLIEMPAPLLDKCLLPDDLLAAIEEFKRLPNKHGARRRQMQYIGKLMRNIDTAHMEKVLEEESRHAALEKRRFQRLETLREELLAGNQQSLDELIHTSPGLDIQFVRQLIRQAGKEKDQGKPPAAARKLFAYLRELPTP